MDIIAELAALNDDSRIDITIDLEVLGDDLTDLNKQLNRLEIWISRHKPENVDTQTIKWADFSGFGVSDINFSQFQEKNKQIVGLSQNLSKVENLLDEKKRELENRIASFDIEVRKIQKEMETEKIRLEKLEKEKYFQEAYFETKSREIDESESSQELESLRSLLNSENGKY
ncbi:MAG: hypothetical protein SCK70_05445 [bacterium]|nr:hypothetical protein [bacterium]